MLLLVRAALFVDFVVRLSLTRSLDVKELDGERLVTVLESRIASRLLEEDALNMNIEPELSPGKFDTNINLKDFNMSIQHWTYLGMTYAVSLREYTSIGTPSSSHMTSNSMGWHICSLIGRILKLTAIQDLET